MGCSVQGCSLPRWCLCSFAPHGGAGATFPAALLHRLSPCYVRPIKADEQTEKTMTIIIFILPINTLKRFGKALAKIIGAMRRRR